MINVEAEIQKLLKEIGPGRMSSTAYDTAWVARLGEVDQDLSNQAMEWLSENQLPDGSWGAKDIFYYHDRVISTLAAMIALTQRGRRTHDKLQIEKGLFALEHITSGATQGLASDPNGATVGFEMIVPTLVAEAEKLGIIKQQGERILGRLSSMRTLKLSKLAGRKINRYVTPAFSAEMAGLDGQHMLDIENLQEANGSIGQSPSATAYYVSSVRNGDPLGINYIRQAIGNDKGAPDLFPFDVYERAWVLWNLGLVGAWSRDTRSLMTPHLEYLKNSWKTGSGIGFSAEYSIPDGDDTIITYELLKKNKYEIDIESVLNFEESEYFRCYYLEVGVSPSVNIHALMALYEYGLEFSHPTIQKIFNFLESQKNDVYWVDKWNSSPFYSSAHYVIACTMYKYEMAKYTVDWIIKSQRLDGSWGHFQPTAEETAYCLQALCLWNKRFGVPKNIIQKGRNWLIEHTEPPYPPIWIGKGLYSAELVARSAILSALRLTEEVL
jgi:halimadienyl-diphosphate synthase